MKGKANRKHSRHGNTIAFVLLKLFISDNDACHTMSGTLYSNVNNIHSIIPEDQKNNDAIQNYIKLSDIVHFSRSLCTKHCSLQVQLGL